MKFKEVERRVKEHSELLCEAFHNQSLERVLDRIDIKEVGSTGTGVKYHSKYVYKWVLNKAKYTSLVLEYYLKNIQPHEKQSNKKAKKREPGRNITQREFFELIFRDNFEHRKGEFDKGKKLDEDGNRGAPRRIEMKSFLVNIDAVTKVIDNKSVVRDIEKLIKKARKFGHFTPNMFISHKFFTKEMLSLLGVIVLDFDLDSHGMVLSKDKLRKYIKARIKVEPAMIWDTKTLGNYQAAILIEPMTGTPSSVHLYEQIVKEMIHKLKIADEACANANHLFSIGRNDKRNGKYIRKFNNKVHSINEFRWLLHERDKRRKEESKVVNFKEFSVKNHPAVKALYDGEVHWRNHAAFTLALVNRWLGYDQVETENFMYADWYHKVNKPGVELFTKHEMQNCIRHAYSGDYKCFHSKWIEITTGIDCDLSGYFHYRSRYISKGIYKTDTAEKVVEFLKSHQGKWVGSKKELADAIDRNFETVKKILESMRKNNDLQYETARGRGAKTTFELVESKKTVFDIELKKAQSKGIEQDIADIQELENVALIVNF